MDLLTIFRQKPEYINFCIPELKSLLDPFNKDPLKIFEHELSGNQECFKEKPYLINKDIFKGFPFVYVKVDNELVVQKIMERAILIKAFVKIFAEGSTYEELFANLEKNKDQFKDYIERDDSFSFEVEAHNRSLTKDDQDQIIDKFGFLPFKGQVDIKNAKRKFWVIEDYITDHKKNYTLKKLYFGIQVIKKIKGKSVFTTPYALSNRAYLGPTSTDNDLAFLMANQAKLTKGHLVFDPFVGTGGLLIPASYFGAFCFGGEIDIRVLMGYGVGRYNKQSKYDMKDDKPNIWLNFKQYDFPFPEIIRMDSSKQRLRKCEFFDAIVCDPPYGIRAGARATGMKESKKLKQAQNAGEEEEEKESIKSADYIIPTKVVTADDVVLGLFSLAEDVLKLGGRLVFLYPVLDTDTFKLDDLPKNPHFKLIDCSENVLHLNKSRLLITMEKINP